MSIADFVGILGFVLSVLLAIYNVYMFYSPPKICGARIATYKDHYVVMEFIFINTSNRAFSIIDANITIDKLTIPRSDIVYIAEHNNESVPLNYYPVVIPAYQALYTSILFDSPELSQLLQSHPEPSCHLQEAPTHIQAQLSLQLSHRSWSGKVLLEVVPYNNFVNRRIARKKALQADP